MVQGKSVRFLFSSFGDDTVVDFIKLSVIRFSSKAPGLLHIASILEKYNIEKNTEIEIQKKSISSLGSYIIGILSFSLSISIPKSMFVDFSNTFILNLGSQNQFDVDYLAISYVVFDMVDCGRCLDYVYSVDGLCRESCPTDFYQEGSYCIPQNRFDCRNGYLPNRYDQCIPDCGENR